MRTQYFQNEIRPMAVYCFVGNSPTGQTIEKNHRTVARGIPNFWTRREFMNTGAGITQITRNEAEKIIGRKSFRYHIKLLNTPRVKA